MTANEPLCTRHRFVLNLVKGFLFLYPPVFYGDGATHTVRCVLFFRCWWSPCPTGAFCSCCLQRRWSTIKVGVSLAHSHLHPPPPPPPSPPPSPPQSQQLPACCVCVTLCLTLRKLFLLWFSPEQRGRFEKNLQALFIFQESRVVVKYGKNASMLLYPSIHPSIHPSMRGVRCVGLPSTQDNGGSR